MLVSGELDPSVLALLPGKVQIRSDGFVVNRLVKVFSPHRRETILEGDYGFHAEGQRERGVPGRASGSGSLRPEHPR